MIFDTHAHYDDQKFEEDRDALLAELPSGGVVGVINAGCDVESSRASIALAERYDYVYATVGYHPHEALHMDGTDAIAALAAHPKVVAIGEIGLDYYYDFAPRSVQKDCFAAQIALSRALELPFVVHERDACGDCLDILRAETIGDRCGVFHCFSGSRETAKTLLDWGFMLSIGGIVTFKNNVKTADVVRYMPMDRLLLETDAPYLAPVPYRGKRNDSRNIRAVAETIGALRGMTADAVLEQTCQNARQFFRI